MIPRSVLFLGKAGDAFASEARQQTEQAFDRVLAVSGKRGTPLPVECLAWEGDLIVSYLAPWVLPKELLAKATLAAINFHPGPPEFPGVGCTNFALYSEVERYGVTCHHMAAQVDTGPIIAVRRFDVSPDDTVWSLTQRAYEAQKAVFDEVLAGLVAGAPLPESSERWQRRPYRRSELNALCRITPDMDDAEVRRRVRAVTFPGMPGAYVELGGVRFDARPDPKERNRRA